MFSQATGWPFRIETECQIEATSFAIIWSRTELTRHRGKLNADVHPGDGGIIPRESYFSGNGSTRYRTMGCSRDGLQKRLTSSGRPRTVI